MKSNPLITDPGTKFHIKKWLVSNKMTPNISHNELARIAKSEGLFTKSISNKEIYHNIFQFMIEHKIDPKEDFPNDFQYPWLSDEEKNIRKDYCIMESIEINNTEKAVLKPKSNAKKIIQDKILNNKNEIRKTIDEIDEDIIKEINELKFVKEDYLKKDRDIAMSLWNEKEDILLEISTCIEILESINNLLEIYELRRF